MTQNIKINQLQQQYRRNESKQFNVNFLEQRFFSFAVLKKTAARYDISKDSTSNPKPRPGCVFFSQPLDSSTNQLASSTEVMSVTESIAATQIKDERNHTTLT